MGKDVFDVKNVKNVKNNYGRTLDVSDNGILI